MKTCSRCNQEKSFEEYHKKTSERGRSRVCKECFSKYYKGYYAQDPQGHTRRINENARKRRAALREVVDKIKSGPCTDCKDTHPPYVMEFDHVRGTKKRNVSNLVMTGAALSTVLTEIEKCDLVCANCHRKRTHQRKQVAA